VDILSYLLLPLAGPEEFDLEVCAHTIYIVQGSCLIILVIGPGAFTARPSIPSAK
jgi:hypothetical protein